MKLKHIVKTGFGALVTNASRSALTILGIVIGITAIILLMSIGQGAQELILSQIRGLGSTTIIIEPGREPKGPSDFAEVFTDSLRKKDLDAILKPTNVQGLKEAAPAMSFVATVGYENESKRTNVIGASELFTNIMDIYPDEGNFFSEEDIKSKASVAVIGADVREELFGAEDAVGKKIKIKDRTFRVVGTLFPKGQVSFFNVDDLVIVPYTTAQQYLLGVDYFHSIFAKAENEEIVPRVVRDLETTLRELHDIDDPEKDDFHITTQEDAASRVSVITGVLTALLVSVAAISLVVGGIGIMNIMLVSVTERTREIGLRKALGATNKNILHQFLFESIALTLAGGAAGIFFGATFSFLAAVVLRNTVASGWAFVFPLNAVFLGLGVSAAVGLVFGIYPAKKAAEKNPIEALRYE